MENCRLTRNCDVVFLALWILVLHSLPVHPHPCLEPAGLELVQQRARWVFRKLGSRSPAC